MASFHIFQSDAHLCHKLQLLASFRNFLIGLASFRKIGQWLRSTKSVNGFVPQKRTARPAADISRLWAVCSASTGVGGKPGCSPAPRFLYICEDGLVHYCSQQRGHPAIPLERYTREDLLREGAKKKGCAPFCTISCVHQTAMLDEFRTRPREVLTGIINRSRDRDPSWRPPAAVRGLEWMFLRDSRTRDFFGTVALRLFGIRRSRPIAPR